MTRQQRNASISSPAHEVYQRFNDSLIELRGHQRMLREGLVAHSERATDAANGLGLNPDREHISSVLQSALRFDDKLLLIYTSTVIDALLCDYGCEVLPHVKRVKIPVACGSDWSEVPFAYSTITVDEQDCLQEANWGDRISKKVKRAISETEVKLDEATALAYQQLCQSFPFYGVLFKTVILRNLEIHSGGKMNARDYKRAPLVQIGKMPGWDSRFLECAIDSSCKFNQYLYCALSEE